MKKKSRAVQREKWHTIFKIVKMAEVTKKAKIRAECTNEAD
jgi:hypothetical protein